MKAAMQKTFERYAGDIRRELRRDKIRTGTVHQTEKGLTVPSFNTLWRRRRAHFDALDWLGACRSFLLFAAAIMTLLLVFDARYRGFPTVLYMLPLLGLAMARLAGLRLAGAVEERVLAAVCVLGSIAFVLIEGFANGQSLTFGATVVALVAVATDGRFWMPAQDEH